VTLTTADTTFPVKAGETTSCVITNSVNVGSLQVIKVVSNGFGLTKACTDFKFTLDSTEYSWPVGCSSTFDNLAVGSNHSVTETGTQAGYHESYGDDCKDLVIVAGQTKTCTITNTAEQNSVGSLTRQRVLLFDRALLSNIRRTGDGTDATTMSVTFAVYETEAACLAATAANLGGASTENVPVVFGSISATTATVGTVGDGTTGKPVVQISLGDSAGDTGSLVRYWRALFRQTGTTPPNADKLTDCTEITTVRIQQ
jgi:hypothetical protein